MVSDSDVRLQYYIQELKRQLQEARERHNQQAECTALFHLALCYDRQRDYELTHNTFEAVLPLARTLGDKEKEKIALLGNAGALTHLQRYHHAVPFWRDALPAARETA